jgi:competence protein ComEC
VTHRSRPLVALALGFVAGAALPPGAPCAGAPATAALGVGTAALLLALSPPLAPAAFGCAGWLAASSARAARRADAPPTGTEGGDDPERGSPSPTAIEGRIASVPERLDDRARFVLRAPDGRLLLATAPTLPWPLALGDRIRMEARFRRPEGPRNPGGRDRSAELSARGIVLEAHAVSAPVRMAPPSPLALLEEGRRRFADAAAGALPRREAALVRAIGAGDRSGVDPDTADAFARSGLAHLLSVSGLHLAVVAIGAYRVLRWTLARWDAFALRIEPRRAAALAAVPLTGIYALATGADVPVVRSALAATVAFAGVLLDREPEALNVLALAAVAVLAAEPGALLDPSFQLSFASVAGLALWSAPLRRAIPVRRDARTLAGRARELLLSAICASVAATLATAPIVAFHFRRISVLAVVSNVAGIPIGSALTVVAALAALASAVAPPLAAPLLHLCRPLAWLLLAVNDACAAPSWAALGVGSPGIAGVLVGYAALAAAWRWRGAARAVAAIVAALALLTPPHVRHALALRRGGLEVVFLSVGQGDATAFLLPDGSAVLVDGGGEAQGRYDPGARDVVPWLRDAGVTRVAALFLSHPHPDHLFGLPAIAQAFHVDLLLTSGRAGDDAAASALARLPPARGLAPGEVFERAGVRFEALAPPTGSEAWTENDASLVLKVTYGATSVLLTGDVEAEAEAALTRGPFADRLRADVIKIPHHGSASSSGAGLVQAVRPTWAVATVGHANRFGFPAREVVERWQAAGAAVLRTDEGAVRFLSDGRTVRRAPASGSLDALALARERL